MIEFTDESGRLRKVGAVTKLNDDWLKFTAVIPASFLPQLAGVSEEVSDMLGGNPHPKSAVQNGILLQLLAADFNAGYRPPAELVRCLVELSIKQNVSSQELFDLLEVEEIE